MNLRTVVIIGAATLLLAAATAQAHHSFAGTYDVKKTVTIEGTLVGVQLRNPHSFVQIETRDANGQTQTWAAEWSGLPQLAGAGITAHTLKVGDPVIITGNPARTPGLTKLRMVTFKRTSDGFTWGDKPREVVD
jgi:hypothetical protein